MLQRDIDMSKETAITRVHELIDTYNKNVRDGKVQKFSEADVGSKFILPFLEALGWDVKNIDEVREQRRTLTGPVDYSLNVRGTPKLVVEIKTFDESLDATRVVRGREESYPEQAIRYAWHLKVDWVVLSNFVETRLYYSHVRKPRDGLIFKLKFNEYIPNFNKIWILSKESVITGILDTYEKRRLRRDINTEVLGNLFRCRKILVDSISKNNPELSREEIKESVQKILDRILVIRVAEDRGIIGSDSLWKELDSWKTRGLPTPFMRSLKSLFRDFDDVYNSKLFEEHLCEDLKLDNEALESIILTLYGYNFDLISADVLGAIYEDYIGHVLQEAEKGIDIVKDLKKRRKAGIYYTPTHVVDYIVRNTLRELKSKTPKEVSRTKILDPACGSGSFLIKAFDVVKEYYDEYNKDQREKAGPTADLTAFGSLIANPEKRILADNLFGVDLDRQAAEIAAVNLMLKALRKGERLPLILGDNIKCGNSLISGTKEELEKYFGKEWIKERPFNWKEEFPEIFDTGGFDVIIGNPPHGAKLSKEEREFIADEYVVAKGYKNTASLFIERSSQLLREGGILGLVIPKSMTFAQKWRNTREYIAKNLKLLEIADISKAFPEVLLEQVILLCQKRRKKVKSYDGTRMYYSEKPVTYQIPWFLYEQMDAFPTHVDEMALTIYQKIMKKPFQFKKISRTFRGLPLQSKATEQRNTKSEPLLRGEDIRPYFHDAPHSFIEEKYLRKESKKYADLKKPKIVSQRIVAHVLTPTDHIILMSSLDEDGLLNVDTVENTILTDPDYDLKYLLAFLNSKLVSWFTYTFIFNKAVRTMDLDGYYVGKIPIYPAGKKEQQPIVDLVEKLLKLAKDFSEMRVDFEEYVNQYPRIKGGRLRDYYRKVAVKDRRVMIKSDLRGKIEAVDVKEKDPWITFRADYTTEEKQIQQAEVLKLKIENDALRKFIAQSAIQAKGLLGEGNILDKLLRVPIPVFKKDDKENLRTIEEIMRAYLPIQEKSKKLKAEICSLEKEINKKIYEFYSLDPEEIDHIEAASGHESIAVDMLS